METTNTGRLGRISLFIMLIALMNLFISTDIYCQKKNASSSSGFKTFTETVNGISFKMVAIKGGSFVMGSPPNEVGRYDWYGDDADEETKKSPEGPQHKVSLSNFYMCETEVTQELWESVMGDNPSKFSGKKNLPVEQVSWDACQDFIEKLNRITGKKYRLPTEAEWEYACRAGTITPFNTGKDFTSKDGNYYWRYPYNAESDDSKKWIEATTPVKSYSPNSWGLYGMHDNVCEWCSDWYGADYYELSVPNDPTGPSYGLDRVIRGGSWSNFGETCRSASRYDINSDGSSDYSFKDVGLRLACEHN